MRFLVLAALMAVTLSVSRPASAQPAPAAQPMQIEEPYSMCPNISQAEFCQAVREMRALNRARSPAAPVAAAPAPVPAPPPAAPPPVVAAPTAPRQAEQTTEQCIALCDPSNRFCPCNCRHLLWNEDGVCRNTQDTLARLVLLQQQQREATSNLRGALNPLLGQMRRDVVPEPPPIVQPDLSRPRARRRRR